MWVDPNYRMTGLGRTLLEALEARYKEQGYNNINLVTHQFQAVAFYLKCGFEVEFVRINKNQPKLTKTFFVKFFGAKDGLVHISHLAPERVDRVEDVLNEGDEVLVRVIDVDKRSGKVRLSRKEALGASL